MNTNMFKKIVLPILALAGLFFAINRVVEARRPEPVAQPIVEPPTRPDSVKMIAGSGLVEARRENIPIGVNIPGVVTEVFVKKGEKVRSGAALFKTDDREFKSMLAVREAELAASKAQLHKLIVSPRPEDIPPAKAAAMEAEARMDDAEAALARTERLFHRQMIAASDYDKDRYAYYAAKATYAKAKADLERIMAGSWKEDIEIARAAVQLAQSQVESIKISLERLIVRAPMDGEVLQLNVRLGQFAAMTWKEPMIVLGDSKRLHVRVDIDEPELIYFSKGAPAVATLKGRPNIRFGLKVVYVEPYVIPKQSLTGNNSERVDQRVLQVIYELPDDRPIDVYIGQQMDIYLRAVPPSQSVAVGLGGERTALPFEEQAPAGPTTKPDA
jgi:HlyD family secretion protein